MGDEEGTLESGEKEMLFKIFEFTDLRVRDILRHRSFVKSINGATTSTSCWQEYFNVWLRLSINSCELSLNVFASSLFAPIITTPPFNASKCAAAIFIKRLFLFGIQTFLQLCCVSCNSSRFIFSGISLSETRAVCVISFNQSNFIILCEIS